MPFKSGFTPPNKPYDKQKKRTDDNKQSPFHKKWGEPAWKIAERENVSTTTIHMRVRNYGNPYQRKAKPTYWEAKYGKTIVEISKELYMHPIALNLREKTHGSVYCEDKVKDTGTYRNRKTEQYKDTKHWTVLPQYKGDQYWLMQEHPDYQAQRDIAHQWDCEKHIAIAKRRAKS
jgi:hypothetical protein